MCQAENCYICGRGAEDISHNGQPNENPLMHDFVPVPSQSTPPPGRCLHDQSHYFGISPEDGRVICGICGVEAAPLRSTPPLRIPTPEQIFAAPLRSQLKVESAQQVAQQFVSKLMEDAAPPRTGNIKTDAEAWPGSGIDADELVKRLAELLESFNKAKCSCGYIKAVESW